jgi:hypothetical protein
MAGTRGELISVGRREEKKKRKKMGVYTSTLEQEIIS